MIALDGQPALLCHIEKEKGTEKGWPGRQGKPRGSPFTEGRRRKCQGGRGDKIDKCCWALNVFTGHSYNDPIGD